MYVVFFETAYFSYLTGRWSGKASGAGGRLIKTSSGRDSLGRERRAIWRGLVISVRQGSGSRVRNWHLGAGIKCNGCRDCCHVQSSRKYQLTIGELTIRPIRIEPGYGSVWEATEILCKVLSYRHIHLSYLPTKDYLREIIQSYSVLKFSVKLHRELVKSLNQPWQTSQRDLH